MNRFAHYLNLRSIKGALPLVLLPTLGLVSVGLLTGCSKKSDVADQTVSQKRNGLICANPEWDIGEVTVKGDSVEFHHTFRLRNYSKRTIEIRDVRSDCGCLVTKGYSKTIKPGSESEIKVKISVFGPPGRFRKTLLVRQESESYESEVVALSVVGNRAISDLLYSSPATLSFGTLAKGGSKIKQLVLSRYDGSPVSFRKLVCKDDSISLGGKPVRRDVKGPGPYLAV